MRSRRRGRATAAATARGIGRTSCPRCSAPGTATRRYVSCSRRTT
uniref:CYP711A7 n=1 Tax=Arundo donax TaxID=35708 RepID=A0A0A9H5H0_ARUDO